MNQPLCNPPLSSNNKPTIGILGLGSIGCLIASQIPASLSSFALLKEKFDRFHFTLQKETSTTEFELPAWSGETLDVLLVCCKASQCLAALQQWEMAITKNTQIVLLQNGFGQHDEVHKLYPHNTLFAASTTEGANRKSRFHILHAGSGVTQWGYYSGPKENLKLNITLLSGTHIKQKNIKQILLDKLAINAVINPLTVKYNCPNGDLLNNKDSAIEFKNLCTETQYFFNIMHWPLSFDLLERATSVAQLTQFNISSMLQDVRNQQETEIEYINGYLVNKAKENTIQLPLNEAIYQQVKQFVYSD